MKNPFRIMIFTLWRFIHRVKLGRRGVIIRKGVKFNPKTTFEGGNTVYENCNVSSSEIGYGTYISENSILKSCRIGRFCSIAPDVKIMIGNHPTEKFVSTHPAFFSIRKQSGFTFVKDNRFNEIEYANNEKHIVVIGNDVWIGEGVRILQGVRIGDGAIIGARSLVLRDIEPFSIYAGIPAKFIRKRFSDEIIEFLLHFKWWLKDLKWIKGNYESFSDIEQFIKKNSTYEDKL